MKILKILLVLIFSLFVTDNLPQDAEASGKSYISRSTEKGSDLNSLMKECKLWVEPEPMQKLNRDLEGGMINDVITVLVKSHNGFKDREWQKYDGINPVRSSSRDSGTTDSATLEEERLNYLKFLASVTKSWFHTQLNPHVNTLAVEDKTGDKIFLFVSGPEPFTENKGVGNLKNIIGGWKTLFASKKSAVYDREIEVIDIHTLLGIKSQDFKRFMHFSCNFFKHKKSDDYKGLKSYIGTDNEGNPKFNNIEKAIDEAWKIYRLDEFKEEIVRNAKDMRKREAAIDSLWNMYKEVLLDKKGNFYKENKFKDEIIKKCNGTEDLKTVIDEICTISKGEYFNNAGSFLAAKDNTAFRKLMEDLLKILSFCEISKSVGASSINVKNIRDNIIKFLSNKKTAKELIEELVKDDFAEATDKEHEDAFALLEKDVSEEKHGIFPKLIEDLLHTEKILVTGLRCLELSDKVKKILKEIKNIKNNNDTNLDKNLIELSKELSPDEKEAASPMKRKLSIVEAFILETLKSKDNADYSLRSGYRTYIINYIKSLYDIIEKFGSLKDKSLNIVSFLKVRESCTPYIETLAGEVGKEHSVFHSVKKYVHI